MHTTKSVANDFSRETTLLLFIGALGDSETPLINLEGDRAQATENMNNSEENLNFESAVLFKVTNQSHGLKEHFSQNRCLFFSVQE